MDTLTVSQHIIERQKQFPEATGEYTGLLENIVLAAKIITREVRKAGLVEILGLTGKKNVQGEDVQKLDVFANDTMVKILGRGGHVCIMASEEVEDPIYPVDGYPIGKYVVSFDPLDGSSNIDVNASIGTIFGVHRRRSEGGRGTIEDLLQKGRSLSVQVILFTAPVPLWSIPPVLVSTDLLMIRRSGSFYFLMKT